MDNQKLQELIDILCDAITKYNNLDGEEDDWQECIEVQHDAIEKALYYAVEEVNHGNTGLAQS